MPQVKTGKDALLQMELLMTEITQKINREKEDQQKIFAVELEKLRNKYSLHFCSLLSFRMNRFLASMEPLRSTDGSSALLGKGYYDISSAAATLFQNTSPK